MRWLREPLVVPGGVVRGSGESIRNPRDSVVNARAVRGDDGPCEIAEADSLGLIRDVGVDLEKDIVRPHEQCTLAADHRRRRERRAQSPNSTE